MQSHHQEKVLQAFTSSTPVTGVPSALPSESSLPGSGAHPKTLGLAECLRDENGTQHLHRKSCQLHSLQMSSDTRSGKLDHEMQMNGAWKRSRVQSSTGQKGFLTANPLSSQWVPFMCIFQEPEEATPSPRSIPKGQGPRPRPPAHLVHPECPTCAPFLPPGLKERPRAPHLCVSRDGSTRETGNTNALGKMSRAREKTTRVAR